MPHLGQMALRVSFARAVRGLNCALWVLCTLGSVACGANTIERPLPPVQNAHPRDVTGAPSSLPGALRTAAQIQSRCSQAMRVDSVRQLSLEEAGPPQPQEADGATPVVIAVGHWTLRATQHAVAPPVKIHVVGPAYRWTLELSRDGHVQRRVVIGKAISGVPSLALNPDGDAAVAWSDRSSNAQSIGGTGGAYTLSDENFVARFGPGDDPVETRLFNPTSIELASVPSEQSEPTRGKRLLSALQLGWWSGAFRAVASDAQGLKQWRLDADTLAHDVELIDARGHAALLGVSAEGRAAVAYQRVGEDGHAASAVFVQLSGERRLGGGLRLHPAREVPSFAALRSTPNGWWLVSAQRHYWPETDMRREWGREFVPVLAHFVHIDLSGAPVFDARTALQTLPAAESLVTPLHSSLTHLEAVGGDDTHLFGRFWDSARALRFAFSVVNECSAVQTPKCSGRVVSRAVGQVSPLAFSGGRLELELPAPLGEEFPLRLRAPQGNTLWERGVPYDITELRISRDQRRILAFRNWDGLVAFSLQTSELLWTAELRGESSCMLETERGTVIGHLANHRYAFNLVAADGQVSPLFALAGDWAQCALAQSAGGLLVATSYDDRPGAADGTHVFSDVRQEQSHRTRVAPLSYAGVALGPAFTMPGGAPVAWLPTAGSDVRFLTAQWARSYSTDGPRAFVWGWHGHDPVLQPAEARLGYQGVPSDFADASLPTWDVWRGDERSCDE